MPPLFYLGLCAIAKDENPFVREWVGYHHYIGFERVYIYDNDSALPVRDIVGDFYEQGICDTYTLPGSAIQLTAYNHCLKNHGHEFEWLAFFDLDEFLCLKEDADARVLLRNFEAYSGLALNWDIFGSSGHLGRPAGLVTENFRQSLGYSVNAKCIVRPAKVHMPFTSHHFLFHEGISVNTNLDPAVGAYAPLAVDQACLNHYYYRSQQDFEAKTRKTDATYGDHNPRSMNAFYDQARRQGEEHAAILPLAGEAARMLDSGCIRLRQNVLYAETVKLTLPETLALLRKFMRAGQLDMAETLFALCYAGFSREVEFLRLGAAICRLHGKKRRALHLAKECLTLVPEEASYLDVLTCLVDDGQIQEAVRLADYLTSLGKITKDATLNRRVQEERNRIGASQNERA